MARRFCGGSLGASGPERVCRIRQTAKEGLMEEMDLPSADRHRLHDRFEIEQLLTSYGYAIDRRDRELWLQVWHENAIYDVVCPRQTCTGHAELLIWLDAVGRDFQITNHFGTNTQIHFTGTDTATAVGRCAAMFVGTDGSYSIGAATYDDRLERRDGQWRLSYRRVDANHLAFPKEVNLVLNPDRA